MKLSKYKAVVVSLALAPAAFAQNNNQAYFDELNVINTSVPVLAIGPDARHGAMGDVGAATSPDANAVFWNSSKLAFLGEGVMDINLNYTPWLNRLVPDIDLSYVSFAYGLDDRQAIGASLRYFSLGDIQFRNDQGDDQGTYNPYEMSFDVAYARKLSENWSAGVALRYIFSDLTQGYSGADARPGQSVSTDLSFYYRGREFNMPDGQRGRWVGGLAITNVGAKISYSESGDEDFLPTNLRIGGGFEWQLDQYNQLRVLVDVNRLMVPTAPERDVDGNIVAGEDDDVGVIPGIFQSFDPGAKPNGWEELWTENMYNFGLEYWYDQIFAVRGGYQNEHVNKGNRKYFTMGIGIRYNKIGMDLSYLIPANATVRSPLENTLRFSLYLNLNRITE